MKTNMAGLCAALLLGACAASAPAPAVITPAAELPATASPVTETPPPATVAPDSAQSCVIVATRTPAPAAPTFAPNNPDDPVRRVDPHVEICASAAQIKVGESVTIIAAPVDIGLPYYMLSVKNADSADWTPVARVTYENQVTKLSSAADALEFISAQGEMRQAVFVLRASNAGAIQVIVGATGEVHYGYPGPASSSGGGSEALTIQVMP